MTLTQYKWHQHKWRRYVFAVVMIAIALYLFFTRGAIDSSLFIFTVSCDLMVFVSLVLSLLLLIEQDTRIDATAGIVICEHRLFGRYLVYRRRESLSGFSGVEIQRLSNPDDVDTVFVGLRRHSGRLMGVQYVDAGRGKRSCEAERIAQSLSESTGLDIHEDVT